ncbi:hypothetical protein Bbelb_017580 [Branchiostoma belcheri]|nr:hypothetical protein Bbelb_017580 [Branchiostoma belcheri]
MAQPNHSRPVRTPANQVGSCGVAVASLTRNQQSPIAWYRKELCSLEVLAMGTLSPPALLKDLPVLISPTCYSMVVEKHKISVMSGLELGTSWFRVEHAAATPPLRHRYATRPHHGTRSVACQDSNPGPFGSESSTLPLRHTTPPPI